jgi:hypothetical protein
LACTEPEDEEFEELNLRVPTTERLSMLTVATAGRLRVASRESSSAVMAEGSLTKSVAGLTERSREPRMVVMIPPAVV